MTTVLSLANQILRTIEPLRLLSKCCENLEKFANSFKKEKTLTRLALLFYEKKNDFSKKERKKKPSKALKKTKISTEKERTVIG